jgi:hypothetical protein
MDSQFNMPYKACRNIYNFGSKFGMERGQNLAEDFYALTAF